MLLYVAEERLQEREIDRAVCRKTDGAREPAAMKGGQRRRRRVETAASPLRWRRQCENTSGGGQNKVC